MDIGELKVKSFKVHQVKKNLILFNFHFLTCAFITL